MHAVYNLTRRLNEYASTHQGRRRFFFKTGKGKTGTKKNGKTGKTGKKSGKTGNFSN
jgi:hypothetical protein